MLLRREALARSFDFLDLKLPLVHTADILHAKESKMLWWKDDTHWNVEGHRVVSDILLRDLNMAQVVK
jgi:hypothetical protein